jgi:hypothetical protein
LRRRRRVCWRRANRPAPLRLHRVPGGGPSDTTTACGSPGRWGPTQPGRSWWRRILAGLELPSDPHAALPAGAAGAAGCQPRRGAGRRYLDGPWSRAGCHCSTRL